MNIKTKIKDTYVIHVLNKYGIAAFDAVEVQGVRNLSKGVRTEMTVDNTYPEFFSVYLHQKAAGVHCVGDFTIQEDAQDYATNLGNRYSWPVRDYSPLHF
jgi:hypothetical protein